MGFPCIQFNDVRKQYGKQSVLAGINLTMQQGEFLGLAGVNGAGKTTMIKCLLDLASVNSGTISISGLTHTQTESRNVLAFLPEKFTPPYYLTGRDFMNYMAALHGMSTDQARIQQILATLDFNINYLDKPVRQLSKGMSQKLGLAACFLSNRQGNRCFSAPTCYLMSKRFAIEWRSCMAGLSGLSAHRLSAVNDTMPQRLRKPTLPVLTNRQGQAAAPSPSENLFQTFSRSPFENMFRTFSTAYIHVGEHSARGRASYRKLMTWCYTVDTAPAD